MSCLGVDVDGVLASFTPAYMHLFTEVTGRDLWKGEVSSDTYPPTWQFDEAAGYTAKEISAVWKAIRKDTAFWFALDPQPGALEALDHLRYLMTQGHDIYFPTARCGLMAKLQTEAWLAAYGFPGATVILTSSKADIVDLLDFDVYIDDRLKNANEVMRMVRRTSSLTRVYLDTKPYNQKPVMSDELIEQGGEGGDELADPALIRVRGVQEMLALEGL